MALMHCNFFSQTLMQNTNMYVIIPTPDSDELLNNKKVEYFKPEAKYQTLYLLHGGYGDYSDWVRFTSIEKYAQENKVAIVMASAGNSFYTDMSHGGKYFTFISEEVPKFARAMFPLSDKREDNFVAGLSMGGYGAFKLALANPSMFECAASLSGVLDITDLLEMSLPDAESTINLDDIWGDTSKVKGSKSDLLYICEKLYSENIEIPKLFQACGTDDFLYDINVSVRDRIREIGVDLTYEEGPGGHTWDYWDENIKKVFSWLPLKKNLV